MNLDQIASEAAGKIWPDAGTVFALIVKDNREKAAAIIKSVTQKALSSETWHPASDPPNPEDLPILAKYSTNSYLAIHGRKTLSDVWSKVSYWQKITPPTPNPL
jgi:hypothetical protein